jgi:hypothetical protein
MKDFMIYICADAIIVLSNVITRLQGGNALSEHFFAEAMAHFNRVYDHIGALRDYKKRQAEVDAEAEQRDKNK